MFNPEDLNSLPLDMQVMSVWEYGVHLLSIPHPFGTSFFYAIGNYYVEVVLTNNKREVIEVTGFKKGVRLDRMLHGLDLDLVE